MGDTTISWTDATWNPTRGCRRVSAGCERCYAERQANRFAGEGGAYEGLVKLTANGPRWSGATRFATEHLADPLRWRKPRRIFVDSMSDLFYEGFSNEQIAAVFGVMAAAPQHTFQVLTKRARRMREWFEWLDRAARLVYGDGGYKRALWCSAETHEILREQHIPSVISVSWPLPNVWLGVSVENQDAADDRIPELLQTPAAIRFLSCEPLLGPVDLHAIQIPEDIRGRRFSSLQYHHDDRFGGPPTIIDWVIAGCESGPGARPCDVAWLRALRDQCETAGVPYFLKQAIGFKDDGWHRGIDAGPDSHAKGGGVIELPYLDGVQHAAFPDPR